MGRAVTMLPKHVIIPVLLITLAHIDGSLVVNREQ